MLFVCNNVLDLQQCSLFATMLSICNNALSVIPEQNIEQGVGTVPRQSEQELKS